MKDPNRIYPRNYNPCDHCDVPLKSVLPCINRKCACIDCEERGCFHACNDCTKDNTMQFKNNVY